MKNIILLSLIVSCSNVPVREFASLNPSHSIKIDLSQEVVFANGANFSEVILSVIDEEGRLKPSSAADFQLSSDQDPSFGRVNSNGFEHRFPVIPKVESSNVQIRVMWNNQAINSTTLKTTLTPSGNSMAPLRSPSSTGRYVSGLSYKRQSLLPNGQYEEFEIKNHGPNDIVKGDEVQRGFEFKFPELARQNIAMMVNDHPNGTISHSMHSYFMFFPRNFLPYANVQEDRISVTLPTGEKLEFSKKGEIVEGVFDEGPVDTGPDRFKRHYADLKYRGKGIILRANARGQMPQTGQFESTAIDMEFGIKFSAQVLIINGSTGQRCRRPKTDFWDATDKSPILFKFPSDEEFDEYLKKNCGFGIPQLDG